MRGFESLILCQKNTNHIRGWCFSFAVIGIRTHRMQRGRAPPARAGPSRSLIKSNPSSSAIRFTLDPSESRGFFFSSPLLMFRMFWISKADFCFPLSAYGLDKGLHPVCTNPMYLKQRKAIPTVKCVWRWTDAFTERTMLRPVHIIRFAIALWKKLTKGTISLSYIKGNFVYCPVLLIHFNLWLGF